MTSFISGAHRCEQTQIYLSFIIVISLFWDVVKQYLIHFSVKKKAREYRPKLKNVDQCKMHLLLCLLHMLDLPCFIIIYYLRMIVVISKPQLCLKPFFFLFFLAKMKTC